MTNANGITAKGICALLVEDSDDDAWHIEQLAEASDIKISMDRLRDGEAAITYLTERATSDNGAGIPHFVLLDLSLPKVGGIDILRKLKADPLLADIPVIILSGTENEEDIRLGQELKAHTHIVKPMSAQEFVWIVRSVENYWPRIYKLRALASMR